MHGLKTFAVLISFVSIFGIFHPAFADAIGDCCMRAAAQHGYTGADAQCYTNVCLHYMTMNRDGHSCTAHGKAFESYRYELDHDCKIQR